jgi:hypothetical protein
MPAFNLSLSALKSLGSGLNKFKNFATTGTSGAPTLKKAYEFFPKAMRPGVPLAAGYLGAQQIPWLYDIGKGGVTAAGQQAGWIEDPQEFNLRDAKTAYAQTKRLLAQKRKEQYDLHLLRQETAQNAAILASTAPHLYNQILAGRRLPKGATVLGGAPRTDLLEELAYRMTQGEFASGSPSNMPSEYVDFNDLL